MNADFIEDDDKKKFRQELLCKWKIKYDKLTVQNCLQSFI